MTDSTPAAHRGARSFSVGLVGKLGRYGIAATLALLAMATRAEARISVGWTWFPAVAHPVAAAAASDPTRDWVPERIQLESPSIAALSAARATVVGPRPPQIGFSRPVPFLDTVDAFAARQAWHETPSGHRALAFQVTSPKARALRLGLRVVAIPDDAVIRFYDPDRRGMHSVGGAEIKATIQRNLVAGDRGEDAETYWSPVIEGESQILDIELPPGVDPSALRMALPRVSHLFQSPLEVGEASPTQPLAAVSCNLDATCYPQWAPESSATASMVFTDQGMTSLCTGTLLNDADETSFVPYFLSANHCISTQSAASTLQTFWFYRSASCGGGPGPSQTRTGGATLLYTSGTTDTSFMRLLDDPPAGAVLAGWSAGPPLIGESLTALHHPDGDLQKISFGQVEDYADCTFEGEDVSCTLTQPEDGGYFAVAWTSGSAQPGSSGSGIFNSDHELLGTLSAVSQDYCAADRFGVYGRFDSPFDAALYQWLDSFTPETGWWWSPQEGGRGYTIEIQNGKLFIGAFLYDASGRPTWLSSGGLMSGPTAYSDSLGGFANGQTLTGPYQAPVPTGPVGTVSIEFQAADRATLTWPGGSVPLERFVFGQGARSAGLKPETGWWWNAAESGRGFAIEVQGDTLFIAGYLYDALGSPIWLTAHGTLDANNHLSASWVQFGGGQTLTGPYVAPTVTNPNVGSVILQFLSPTSALLTLPDARQIPLSRFLF